MGVVAITTDVAVAITADVAVATATDEAAASWLSRPFAGEDLHQLLRRRRGRRRRRRGDADAAGEVGASNLRPLKVAAADPLAVQMCLVTSMRRGRGVHRFEHIASTCIVTRSPIGSPSVVLREQPPPTTNAFRRGWWSRGISGHLQCIASTCLAMQPPPPADPAVVLREQPLPRQREGPQPGVRVVARGRVEGRRRSTDRSGALHACMHCLCANRNALHWNGAFALMFVWLLQAAFSLVLGVCCADRASV